MPLKRGKLRDVPRGREEGEKRFGMLMSILLEENRYDDASKASADADFHEKLFKEYGI